MLQAGRFSGPKKETRNGYTDQGHNSFIHMLEIYIFNTNQKNIDLHLHYLRSWAVLDSDINEVFPSQNFQYISFSQRADDEVRS